MSAAYRIESKRIPTADHPRPSGLWWGGLGAPKEWLDWLVGVMHQTAQQVHDKEFRVICIATGEVVATSGEQLREVA